MPIKPGKTENEQEFIGRCMSEESESFPDESQRYAVCKSKWDRENMSKITDTAEKVMASINFNTKYEGIKLAEPAEGLEDACWDGYIAVGLKLLGDRMVPNCVPEEEMAKEVETFASEKGIQLADYPWDECIADQTARYESEETAKRVCGWIKSQYGS